MGDGSTLTALQFYPVKSLAPVSITSAAIENRGIVGDRRWMLVDPDGELISQRAFPKLALCSASPVSGGIRIVIPGGKSIDVATPSEIAPVVRSHVWNDSLDLLDAGEATAQLFTDFLGTPVRLVYQTNDTIRPVDPRYRASASDQVSLADGYPLLLTSEASLAYLNGRLKNPVSMDRFRPNLVISGSCPFEEDTWKRICIGKVPFAVVKPCARCRVINVDPATGLSQKEPLRTLSRYRRASSGKVLFGQNLIPQAGGTITLGDEVHLVAD
jgi:uncharacterized protein YcbX